MKQFLHERLTFWNRKTVKEVETEQTIPMAAGDFLTMKDVNGIPIYTFEFTSPTDVKIVHHLPLPIRR